MSTQEAERRRRRQSGAALVVLLAVAVVAAGIGAAGNWLLWHPMDGVIVPIAGIGALVTGGILLAVRRRVLRPLGAAVVVVGVGLIGGYALGPDRPSLRNDVGRMDVALDGPVVAASSAGASCTTVERGDELQLDASLRLPLLPADPSAPPDVDQRAFVGLFLTVGDRWRDGTVHRSDNVDLSVIVGSVIDGVEETRLAASDASVVKLDWRNEGGSLGFADLVDARLGTRVAGPLAGLSGSIAWVCGEAALPAGTRAFAEEACAGASFTSCVDDVIAATAASPGAEVAICEGGEDMGAIVPSDEVAAYEACTGDGETFDGRVLRVVRLPG